MLPDGSPLAAYLPPIPQDVPARALRCQAAMASTLIAGLERARAVLQPGHARQTRWRSVVAPSRAAATHGAATNPPKNRALPNSVASAEISGPRRTHGRIPPPSETRNQLTHCLLPHRLRREQAYDSRRAARLS